MPFSPLVVTGIKLFAQARINSLTKIRFGGSLPFVIMLTGSDLLARVKELGDCAKTDLAKGCGYVVTKKDGSEQVKFTQFYEALLEAKGLTFSSGGAGIGKGGRKLSYKAVVQGNGNLLVGKAYTAMLDLESGDEFTIKMSAKRGFTLVPVGSEDEEGAEGAD